MAKIFVGSVLPDLVFDTPYLKNCRLSYLASRVKGKTALVFLRYYGCTLCQMDIMDFAEKHSLIAKTGGQLIVGLQSDPVKLAETLGEEKLPFDILCDPDQTVYKALQIDPAESMDTLCDESSKAKLERMVSLGLVHGDYEGNELQLPAVFVVTPDLTVTYAHYGCVATDVPTAEELSELLK